MSDINDIHGGIIADPAGLGRVLGDLLRFTGVSKTICPASLAADPYRLSQCDIVIAGLDADGLDMVSALRSKTKSPNPFFPIVLVGADVRLADLQAAIHFGAHDVLALPLSAEQIRARIVRTVFAGRPWIDVDSYFGPCRRRVLRAWPHRERRANAEAERAALEAVERRVEEGVWL